MLQTLPFGPFALPVAPVFAILAVMIGLDVAARYGRVFRIHADDTWNTGMITIATCLIVARLFNIIQFWQIYVNEPSLIVSMRPSGFVWWVGIIGGWVGGYLYLLRRALNPMQVFSALLAGLTAAWNVQSMANYLTGYLVGERSNLPWALPYFGELRHPVAIYELIGMLGLLILLFVLANRHAPQHQPAHHIFWFIVLGWGIILLLTRGLVEEPITWEGFRLIQVWALGCALLACWRLANSSELKQEAGGTTKTG